MKSITDFFASLDIHGLVLVISLASWVLGFLKKMNSVRGQYLAGNIEWSFKKYLYVEWVVLLMNFICLFIIQVLVDPAKKELSADRDWPIVLGAGTLAYLGNDVIVQIFGRAKKYGQYIIDQKTNELEGPDTKTPMPQKLSDTVLQKN